MGIDYQIENGPVFTTLRVKMAQGESFRAEAGAMIAMSPTIGMEAKTVGKGIFGDLKATVGGESLFASL
ncbi:MAG TPA: AIM24 family protein [Bacillota bacterium]